ncbi:hypothetical protein M493_16950 [Geobacillus genomosp. 3]|uniref:Uncharacterized protein n=1 Tax=Geobacillus genomosp. 3 TaxID=1921421 RepID=S5ZH21_GEOG3|nr:hypothetical protein M493_16950 [Geobacillus genomosp. 3]
MAVLRTSNQVPVGNTFGEFWNSKQEAREASGAGKGVGRTGREHGGRGCAAFAFG